MLHSRYYSNDDSYDSGITNLGLQKTLHVELQLHLLPLSLTSPFCMVASATFGDSPHTKAFRTIHMLGACRLFLEPVFCSDIQAQKASCSLPLITWPLHRNHKILRSRYPSMELDIFPILPVLSLQTAMIQMSKGKHFETDF